MRGELRQFLRKANELGFEFTGFDSNGHVRLRNDTAGIDYSVSATPSDYRSRLNELATLERLSGRKLQRANAGHYSHRRVTPLDIQKTDTERQRAHDLDLMVEEAAYLRRRFHELCDKVNSLAPEPRRHNQDLIDEARKVLRRHENIRHVLAQSHRIIPSIERVTV